MRNKILKAGVIGWPIDHSLSPALHRFWLNEYSIKGKYDPFAVKEEDLGNFISGLADNGWRGINVTLPYKQTAMKLVDDLDENAKRIGAVNTISVNKDGSLKGINTDGYGFLKNLETCQPEWSADNGPVVVLGAGGAARSILAALIDNGVREIRLVNRNQIKARKLADDLLGPIEVCDWSDRTAVLSGTRLLINTTSLGMINQDPLEINLKYLPINAIVNDIVYTPNQTTLLRSAQERGNPTVDGLGMLLHQARLGFLAWFGVDPKVSSALKTHVLAAMKT